MLSGEKNVPIVALDVTKSCDQLKEDHNIVFLTFASSVCRYVPFTYFVCLFVCMYVLPHVKLIEASDLGLLLYLRLSLSLTQAPASCLLATASHRHKHILVSRSLLGH